MEKTGKPVDRETLYNEVWTEPVTVVAPRYGLSDVGLAKICRALAIPLPSRGYWAKVKAGRVMGRVPLPKLKTPGPVPTGLVKLPAEKAAVRQAARQSAAKICKEMPPLLPPEEALAALRAENVRVIARLMLMELNGGSPRYHPRRRPLYRPSNGLSFPPKTKLPSSAAYSEGDRESKTTGKARYASVCANCGEIASGRCDS